MSQVKILFLAANTIASHVVLTPPNATPMPGERANFKVNVGNTRTKLLDLIVSIATLAKVAVYADSAVEIATILSAIYPAATKACASVIPLLPVRFFAAAANVGQNIHITLPFTVGWLLIVGGAAIRVTCYRYLGRHFTFELALRKEHKLITSGPYSVVRHPSYTGSIMFALGRLLCMFDEGSLWIQCGIFQSILGKAIGSTAVFLAVFAIFSFIGRTRAEDDMLKREFGQQWVVWADRTPYRLIPYLY
ncbi:hypothetical protein PHLCEN_2v13278 [Hermanssonia centrifuga]|uniref:Protein-S-isoprenylcysteine O-methyltransferase n=1 Tax=Hermanssonia centrifuga TaxID=98765 RepID=A0A2R6NEL9_9APHY|nr:hypothetical protein PHLCEN_2v13278 [Hermanssonia centrifuga]